MCEQAAQQEFLQDSLLARPTFAQHAPWRVSVIKHGTFRAALPVHLDHVVEVLLAADTVTRHPVGSATAARRSNWTRRSMH
jgi:hypothetical protein